MGRKEKDPKKMKITFLQPSYEEKLERQRKKHQEKLKKNPPPEPVRISSIYKLSRNLDQPNKPTSKKLEDSDTPQTPLDFLAAIPRPELIDMLAPLERLEILTRLRRDRPITKRSIAKLILNRPKPKSK